jgi:hypothetical protein
MWERQQKRALKERILNGQEPSGLLDSGATSSFIAPQDTKHLIRTGLQSSKIVRMPNGITEKAGEILQMGNGLRNPANTADSIPSLKTTLVSNSKLADANYITVYDREEVNVYDAEMTKVVPTKQAVMTGWRDRITGLWRVPLQHNVANINTDTAQLNQNDTNAITDEVAANVYDLPSTERVIRYLHAAAGFPTKSTWLQAIKAGFCATWPMLTTKNVTKHFPESEETQKGHMKQIRSGIRKTNCKVRFVMDGKEETLKEIDLSIAELRKKRDDVMIKVYECTQSTYSDQTGRFPITSSRGMKYVMVMCEIDGNQILVEPMRSRKANHLVQTYRTLIQRLKASNIHPKMHFMDNEAPEELKQLIRGELKMTLQLITPDSHRANIAERAIQTFKNHFCSILAGVDDSFSMHLWDRLLPQAKQTLNMLRPSNVSPNVSAYMHAHGTHDYNAQPFAPMGCAVQLFETPEARKS